MKTVVAAALGECVHVAGVMNFLRLAEAAGWRTVFLGPGRVRSSNCSRPPQDEQADLVGVSYRLTPETGERLLGEFAEAADELHARGVRFAFGGTPPVAERRAQLGFFERVFDGSEPAEQVLAYLKGPGRRQAGLQTDFPQTHDRAHSVESRRIPILRHHFGLPTMEATRAGHRADRRSAGAGCDLAGDRPGCAGEFLPPRAAGSAPQGRGRGAGAQRGRLPRAVCGQPARQLPAAAHLFRHG